MHVAFLAFAFQLQVAALPAPPAQGASATHPADSTRDLKAARSAQAAFEFARRNSLPEGYASRGQCDVRLGRWWHNSRRWTSTWQGIVKLSGTVEPGLVQRRDSSPMAVSQ